MENYTYEIPLILDASLASQREALHDSLMAAQKRLGAFADRHRWGKHMRPTFAREARIFADKSQFDHDLLELCGMDTATVLPRTYCAALENGVLMSVSPELYREIYPEGDEEVAFEKLLAHEMAHRLHIRILNGDEEAMGPVWFYEGFALFAAGQFERNAPKLTAEEMLEVVRNEERSDYRRYVTVIRYLIEKVGLEDLVKRAGKREFSEEMVDLFE